MTQTTTPVAPTGFRKRLLDGAPLLGTFIKIPTGHATEILGDVGFDFVVIDEEHGPFDKGTTELAVLAARASNVAGIVRVASPSPEAMLAVLDCGATGVLVPHVSSADKARAIVAACRYRGGSRGFSNTTRAGNFGSVGFWDHVDACDAKTTVIAMIEDPEALDVVDEIAAVDGLDGFFIGRGDLTVALGAGAPGDEIVSDAARRIAAAGRAGGKAVLAMTAGGEDAKWLKTLGVTGMIVASDQGFMRQAAAKTLAEFNDLKK